MGYREDAPRKPAGGTGPADRVERDPGIHHQAAAPHRPGIAEINESGGYERQFVIQPRPEALEAVGMTFSELADLIAQNVENAGGGIISRGGEQLTIRAVSRVNSAEEIADLPLKFGAGVKPILVRDVAEVRQGTKFRTGAATLNGREAVIGTTMMLAGQNSREVAERVKARIAEIQTKLPDGVEIQIQYDRSQLIDRTIATVQANLFEGAILVDRAAAHASRQLARGAHRRDRDTALLPVRAHRHGAVRDFRKPDEPRRGRLRPHHRRRGRHRGEHRAPAGREAAPARPRSHRRGADGHASSRASKQVGIADVLRRRHHHRGLHSRSSRSPGSRGRCSARWRSPSCSRSGRRAAAGAHPDAGAVLAPAARPDSRGRQRDHPAGQAGLRAVPPHRVAPAPGWSSSAAIALFAGSLWLFTLLGAEFVPKLDEGSITAMLYKPVGMSMEESLRTDIEVKNRLLKEFPEVTRIFTRIGTSEIATDPMPPNESDVYIFYKPRERMAPDARAAADQGGAARADRGRRSRRSIPTTASSSRSPSKCASTKCSKAPRPSSR